MKLTESRLKRMIKEELKKINEQRREPPRVPRPKVPSNIAGLMRVPRRELGGLSIAQLGMLMDMIEKFNTQNNMRTIDDRVIVGISDTLMGMGMGTDGNGNLIVGDADNLPSAELLSKGIF